MVGRGVFAVLAPKGRRRGPKTPQYVVFYPGDRPKMELPLSEKTYGPTQCKVEPRGIGEQLHENNYPAGWVFLVPLDCGNAAGDGAAPGGASQPLTEDAGERHGDGAVAEEKNRAFGAALASAS